MSTRPLFDQLASRFAPELFKTSTEDLEFYGRDWTRFHEPRPMAVALPRTTEEVAQLLRSASELGISVVPSGGRTGLAGGAVAANGELVLSLERMNHAGPVDIASRTVRVQAGVTLEALHQHCEPDGLVWPVDLAAKGSCHVGGNIATNAGGIRVVRYGVTRNWVLGLQVVLMNGETLELNGALEKNNTGIDLRQLFIGSEGILGIITEATLKLVQLPEDAKTLAFAVRSLDQVLSLLAAARKSQDFDILAFEFLDRKCLECVVKHSGLAHPFAPELRSELEFMVVLELESRKGRELDPWLESVISADLVLDGMIAQNRAQAQAFWAYRERVAECLYQESLPYKFDISVGVAQLPAFLARMHEALAATCPELEVYNFGHIGDGNLHVNLLMPEGMAKDAFKKECARADERVFEVLRDFRGSVSGEHGIGLLKKASLHYSRTETEIELFRGIKRVLDPRGLLNPGKII